MPKYLVAYDLHAPGQHWKSVDMYMAGMSGVRVLETTWIVRSPEPSAATLCAVLETSGVFDRNDQIVVVRADDSSLSDSVPAHVVAAVRAQ